ncbi:MAG: dipeptide epimerase [Bacteroidales bacterium]|jgi:L-alanine-DL-glutamate epimerase-like enolase superfamily enzyme|nr:dipeptide epimerase [Bacteroidales bacterium]
MPTNRRNFLKAAGALTAAAAVLNPAEIFAKTFGTKINKSKKMQLSFIPYTAQLRHVFRISHNARTSTPIVLTRITYDGYTGYGEASMPPYLGESQASVLAYLKRVDLGQFSSPFEMEDIISYLDGITTHNTAAKASVDIALHDLAGKIIGQPWWKIWGFDASKCPNTSYTIGLAEENVVKQKTEEAAPYKVIKVKLGMGEKTDKMMINTIRSVTDKVICVDINQGWKDKHYALDMINWLKERNVNMIEQPMPVDMVDETAWLTENSPLPIIADESCQRLDDILKLKGVFSGINIKLMKCTGLFEARKMVTLAETLHMMLMVGCMTETSCAVSAAAQIAPRVQWADLDGNLLIANDCFSGMKIVNGKVTLTDKPGIGITKTDKNINFEA